MKKLGATFLSSVYKNHVGRGLPGIIHGVVGTRLVIGALIITDLVMEATGLGDRLRTGSLRLLASLRSPLPGARRW
jgi:hypothetical protein